MFRLSLTPFDDVGRHRPVIQRRYLVEATVFWGALMQVNENVGQVQQVKRIPDVDEANLVKKAMLQNLDDGPTTPRPVAAKKPEAATEPKRKLRRYGAGF